MTIKQYVYRTILIYSIMAFLAFFFGTWGFRAIIQEILYHHHFFVLIWCINTFATIAGLTLIGAIFAFLYERTISYLPILTGTLAIAVSFQLPLQKHPEIRYFYSHREDYEAIVELWRNNSLADNTFENYSRHCDIIYYQMQGHEYCILVQDEGLVFFLDDAFEIIMYNSEKDNPIYPCEDKLSYLDDNWIFCRTSLR